MTNDPQQYRLYRAEEEALFWHSANEDFCNLKTCQKYIDEILQSKWFRRHFGLLKVCIKKSPDTYIGSSWPEFRLIRLPRVLLSPLGVLHELVHILTSDIGSSHGKAFAGLFLVFVYRMMGSDAGEALKAAYRKNRVRYTRFDRLLK